MYTADFDAFMPILFQTDFMKAQTVWNTFMAGPIPPNMNLAVSTLKANVNFQLLLRTIVDVFDCNYVLAQYLVYKGPVAFRNQIGTYVDLKNCYRNVFGDYFLANIMDLYDRQLLWTHMFATHPAGFWADILISVNPTEFGRIAFKYFPNEANQLMINANISITDYFSLIESYPALGNAYLSNLKNTLMNMGYTAAGWTYLADEHHIYGSSRVGVHNTNFVLAKRFSTAEMEYTQKAGNQVHFIRGKRNYELSNHLGNVQVVITDKRISVCDNELQTERFEADILMATDYYPFGMAIPERQWYTGSDSSNYRYGFNGMEKDNEAKGPGNSMDFGARIYDSRLGRWMSTDRFERQYVPISTYSFALNSPLVFRDIDGNKIYDLDGNEIKIEENSNGIVLKGNLSKDQQKLLYAMLLIPKGQEIIKRWVNHETEIRLVHTEDKLIVDGKVVHAETIYKTKDGKTVADKDGDGYEDSEFDYKTETAYIEVTVSSAATGDRMDTWKSEMRMAVISVHEDGHISDNTADGPRDHDHESGESFGQELVGAFQYLIIKSGDTKESRSKWLPNYVGHLGGNFVINAYNKALDQMLEQEIKVNGEVLTKEKVKEMKENFKKEVDEVE